jgi:Ca-activated chloride channel homolog
MKFLWFGMVAAGFFALANPVRACELALVLAIDVSGSIDAGEYAFQMQGLADALEDGVIADALVQGQVALSVVQWSGAGEQLNSIPWRRMLSPRHVAEFADEVRGLRRRWTDSKTAIGDLLAYAGPLFAAVPDCRRRVLDISGDGQINAGEPTGPARARLIARGVTINGIAIDRVGFSIARYYRTDIIGGFDAFVMASRGYSDYPRSIREKLFREVIRPSS